MTAYARLSARVATPGEAEAMPNREMPLDAAAVRGHVLARHLGKA